MTVPCFSVFFAVLFFLFRPLFCFFLSFLPHAGGVVTHILNDVLSLQKIEDGALTLDCAPFDVDRMVRSTLYSFKAPCKERKLRLKVNLDDLNTMVTVAAQTACTTWTWPSHLSPLHFGVLGDVHRLRQVRWTQRLFPARAALADCHMLHVLTRSFDCG